MTKEMGSKNKFESKELLKDRTTILFQTRDISDCVFQVGFDRTEVQAHKIFLAIASPAFYAMFYGDLAEKGQHITIEDVDSDGFEGMMEYIYTDNVDFQSPMHACKVYVAARKYLLPFLESKCLKYIQSNTCAEHSVEIYEFSKMNSIPEVETICVQMFQRQTKDIVSSKHFLQAHIHTLERIFEMDSMNLGSEIELFKYLEKWAYSEASRQSLTIEELSPKLNSVLKHIRFLTMRGEEFASGPAQSLLLSTEDKLAIGMNIIKPGALAYPENMSMITEYRGYDEDKEATLQYTVYNVSKLTEAEYSPPCFVRNLPWRIIVMPRTCCSDPHSKITQKTLGYFLECNGQSNSSSWQCYATAELKILSQKEGCKNYCKQTQHLYFVKENDWGFSQFISWTDLVNPEKGFIKDDTLKLEVCMCADEPTGVSGENRRINVATSSSSSSIPRRSTRRSNASIS